MPDPISLIASVITILEAINRGIGFAKAFYRAPDELQRLEVCVNISLLHILRAHVYGGFEDHHRTFKSQANAKFEQDQVGHFSNYMKEINDAALDPQSPILAASLCRAETTVKQLDQLIQTKIIKSANGSKQGRRRSWLRNKSRIHKLKDALREHQQDLHAAITSSNL